MEFKMIRVPSMSILYLGGLLLCAEGLQRVLVQTKCGRMVGLRQNASYSTKVEGSVTDTVDVFLGVPYAAPPVGKYRFQPPRPPVPWTAQRDACSPGPVCPQIPYFTQTQPELQGEDCLNLNIYSPYIARTNLSTNIASYPVLVYIHGGSYEDGAGIRQDGIPLALHGVVIVTINYRLGVLGYLTTGDDTLPGNHGLLDQIQALRWISANIDTFRGDPSRVTVVGNSAGGSSVGLLLMTNATKGLFQAAIIQSGSPLSLWSVHNASVPHAQFVSDVAREVGCPGVTQADQVSCLRNVHFAEFPKQQPYYPRISPSNLNFKPRVDGHVVHDFPERQFATGAYHQVPLLMGVVEDEWARSMGFFFVELYDHGIDQQFDDGLDRESFLRAVNHVVTERLWWPAPITDVAVHAYTNWSNVADPIVNREAYKHFTSDLLMKAPSVKFAEMISNQRAPLYFYRFDHEAPHTDPAWWRCYHSLELDYIFGGPFIGYSIAVDKMKNFTEKDREISNFIMKAWTNFAIFKHPTPQPIFGVTWEKFDRKLTNYLHITADKTRMRNNLRGDKMALWNILVPSLLQHDRNSNKRTSADDPVLREYMTLMWLFAVTAFSLLIIVISLVFYSNRLRKRGSLQFHVHHTTAPAMVKT